MRCAFCDFSSINIGFVNCFGKFCRIILWYPHSCFALREVSKHAFFLLETKCKLMEFTVLRLNINNSTLDEEYITKPTNVTS